MDSNHIKNELVDTDGIIVINSEKEIIAFNEAASRISGFNEKEVILKDIKFLFRKSGTDCNHILDTFETGKSQTNISLNITCSDNQIIEVISSITPIKRNNNDIISVVFIFRNTKEMISLVESLNQKSIEILNEKNKFEAIFHSRTEGTFTIDNDWKITSFNRTAERITGFNQEEALGKHCWDIFKSKLCKNGCQMEFSMSDQKLMIDNELSITKKDGEKIPIRVNSAPLIDINNNTIGGVENFVDISEIKNLATYVEERYKFENIIGHSKAMQKVYVLLENVSQTDSTVLITGESGTGKELVARALHLNSSRKANPFIVVNCSAFAETLLESELFGHERGAFTGAIRTKLGHFELAQGGSLFLDEIGDISLPVQVKLLRVLETRKFQRVGGTKDISLDIRLIAATNKNLIDQVKKGNFREDLFYRINVFNIHLPPLRERLSDFPLLITHFIEKLNSKFNKEVDSLSPEALKLLQDHAWKGNIRELENVLEHAFVLCHEACIDTVHLPEWLRINNRLAGQIETPTPTIKNAEIKIIQETLNKFNGNRKQTAEALSIDPSTLWRKMKKLNLS